MNEERPPIESFFQKKDLEPETEFKFLRGKAGGKGDKGDAGLKGDKGEPGKRGFEGPEGEKGDKGDKGERGLMGPKGDDGKNGKDGLDGVNGKDAKNVLIDVSGKEVVEKINKSRGEKIKKSRVEGLEDIENKSASTDRRLQNWISLGGNRQTIIQSNGTTISTGATTLNFTNATIAVPTGNDGSTVNVTTSGSGGGSGFQQKTSGTVDGSNTVFVFATAPKAISVDQGRVMQATSTDGTVNWTGTTTVTLKIAPTFDIFGVA